MTAESFNEKIRLLPKGNKQAWQDIYEEYYAFIYFTALSYVKSKTLAEDIASDVMISLCSPSVAEGNVRNPKTFLYVMTINKIKSLRRRRLEEVELKLASSLRHDDGNYSSVEVSELLIKLSEEERKIFVAHVFWGFSFVEISRQNKWSLSTVKRRYKSACEFMKTYLRDV